jgi:beta-galactosidase
MLEFACSGVRVPSEHPYGPLYGTRAITLGRWHHVAGTYDGKRMALYIDGTLDTAQQASGPIGVDDDPVLIGENAAESQRFWSGLIDDVRVYNYGLSAQEVAELAR